MPAIVLPLALHVQHEFVQGAAVELRERPEVLDAVGMALSARELVPVVENAVVLVAVGEQPVAGLLAVGICRRSGQHRSLYYRHQALPRAVLDDSDVHLLPALAADAPRSEI